MPVCDDSSHQGCWRLASLADSQTWLFPSLFYSYLVPAHIEVMTSLPFPLPEIWNPSPVLHIILPVCSRRGFWKSHPLREAINFSLRPRTTFTFVFQPNPPLDRKLSTSELPLPRVQPTVAVLFCHKFSSLVEAFDIAYFPGHITLEW